MTGANGGANPGRGRVRLLVALDLPDVVRHEVEVWQQKALTDPALRHNRGLRIVLMFLGHRPQREVIRYLEAIRELCASAPAPLIELGDVVAKGPAPELPRVFALPVKSPEAEVLQVGLRSVFTNQNLYIYEPRERTFWPHLTVARVRTADHKARRPERFTTYPIARSRRACAVPSRGEASVSTDPKCSRAEHATRYSARRTCRGRPSQPSKSRRR